MATPSTELGRSRTRQRRAERLEARISRKQKELFKRAAALQGRSLTDFVVSSLQEAATRTVQEYEIMTLSARDREAFVAALLESPEPGDRLKAAYRRHQERMGQ